jgi:hypothetical protein
MTKREGHASFALSFYRPEAENGSIALPVRMLHLKSEKIQTAYLTTDEALTLAARLIDAVRKAVSDD